MPGLQMWKGMHMWKGMKMGKKARNKRRRKSVELTPPTPPLTWLDPSPATDLAIKGFLHRCPKEVLEINIKVRFSLNALVANPNNLLRTKESFKQSWDIGQPRPPYYHEMLDSTWNDPSAKEKVERYLKSAAEKKYFDVPDPKDRPDKMYRGFFVIYPGEKQKDPIFRREPNLIKVVHLISKLGMAAVEYHNFMTDSDLKFSEVKKANLFLDIFMQIYYITFEATDNNLSGKKVTCQSRVACTVTFEDFRDIKLDPVPITGTYVDSFHRVED